MSNARVASKRNTRTLKIVATKDEKPKPEYDDTAWAIWTHYRDNKDRFVSDIRDYRNAIVADIQAGTSIAAAFAPYLAPDKALRKAA